MLGQETFKVTAGAEPKANGRRLGEWPITPTEAGGWRFRSRMGQQEALAIELHTGKINDRPFGGRAAHSWIVTGVDWRDGEAIVGIALVGQCNYSPPILAAERLYRKVDFHGFLPDPGNELRECVLTT